jgi:hypothetical protein
MEDCEGPAVGKALGNDVAVGDQDDIGQVRTQLLAVDQESGADCLRERVLDTGDSAALLEPGQPPRHAFERLAAQHGLELPAVEALETRKVVGSFGAGLARVDDNCAAVAGEHGRANSGSRIWPGSASVSSSHNSTSWRSSEAMAKASASGLATRVAAQLSARSWSPSATAASQAVAIFHTPAGSPLRT